MNKKTESIGGTLTRLRNAKGLSQHELAQRAGVTQSTIDRIERGIAQKSRYLPAIAVALEVRLEDLDPSYKPNAIIQQQRSLDLAPPLMGGRDFPVYASAEAGPGEIIRSTDAVDWVPRPAPVQHVREAYGLITTGESMIPEFEPGDTAIVNPLAPAFSGTTCVFYSEHDGEARATIKRLLKTAPDKWLLKQWNPPPGHEAEFTLSRKVWTVCHRVVGKYTRQ